MASEGDVFILYPQFASFKAFAIPANRSMQEFFFLLTGPVNSHFIAYSLHLIDMSKAPSTRWCPTPEQLLILEQMFNGGIRTPNAVQIQQITAFLSSYGSIEGKNVFYWFQNHKARERQRLRRWIHHQQLLLRQAHLLMPMEVPVPPPQPPPPFQIMHPYFLHQVSCEEAKQTINYVCQMEGGEEMRNEPIIPAGNEEQWMVKLDDDGIAPARPRPLKTLDLFPTTSTGLKDECSSSISKSSSCSTATGAQQNVSFRG